MRLHPLCVCACEGKPMENATNVNINRFSCLFSFNESRFVWQTLALYQNKLEDLKVSIVDISS